MDNEQPQCPHCKKKLDKWELPDNSTWEALYHFVCFNDECSYYVRGWDHMMETQKVKASYRLKFDPETGATSPLPCWSPEAHKDKIIKD